MPLRNEADPRLARAAVSRQVGSDIAALRFKLAAWNFRRTLMLEARFNPNHDELGRFTFADGAISGGEGMEAPAGDPGNDRVQVAQAPRVTRRITVGGQNYTATESEATELIIGAQRADAALNRVRQLDSEWRPPPSLTSNESARGAIEAYRALAQQAEARATVVERGGVPLGFNSMEQFRLFGSATRDALMRAGNSDAVPYLRGSAVTGYKYETGAAFDAGRRSDYDFAIVSERLMTKAKQEGIPVIGGGNRTWPLSNSQMDRLGISDVYQFLTSSTQRKSRIVVFRDDDALNVRGPNLRLP